MTTQIESDVASLPLGLTDYATHHPEFVEQVRRLVADQGVLALVERALVADEGYTAEKAATAKHAFLQFASLRYLTDEPTSPTPLVDEFWHTFVLYTTEYREWCDKHFGAFLDHAPGAVPSAFARAKQLIAAFYGTPWENAVKCCCRCKV